MKFVGLFCFLVSFSAFAIPGMSVKDRLRIHLWSEGISERPVKEVKRELVKPLPEELERALRKI